MKSLVEIDNECKRILGIRLYDIESPRHLHLLGIVPVVDLAKLENKLHERHPELLSDEVSIFDIVERNYGAEAVDFVKRYALNIEEKN